MADRNIPETEKPAYEPPRIISHSAQHLRNMTIEVNACNSQFSGTTLKDNEDGGEDDKVITY